MRRASDFALPANFLLSVDPYPTKSHPHAAIRSYDNIRESTITSLITLTRSQRRTIRFDMTSSSQIMSFAQTFRQLAVLYLCSAFLSSPIFAAEPMYDLALLKSHGYLLIRFVGSSGERVTRFEITNVDTGEVVRTNPDLCKSAGANAWMCLEGVPRGRYFWSKYASEYRVGLEFSRNQGPVIEQEQPSSASDTFQVVAGVINYAGDWDISITSDGPTWRYSVDIDQDIKTLQRLFERFPDYANTYEIYLSMMGKEAISFVEFRKIVEQQSGSSRSRPGILSNAE